MLLKAEFIPHVLGRVLEKEGQEAVGAIGKASD
jgi:hypothetical protein